MKLEMYSDEEFNKLNVLTEKELSFLSIKLGKSKRTERDWTQIKAMLKDKYMFTYIPSSKDNFARNVDNMAVETSFGGMDFGYVYMDRQLLEKRLNLMDLFGITGRETIVRTETFETFVEKSLQNNIPIIFDFIEPPKDRYYMFFPESEMLSVQIIV